MSSSEVRYIGGEGCYRLSFFYTPTLILYQPHSKKVDSGKNEGIMLKRYQLHTHTHIKHAPMYSILSQELRIHHCVEQTNADNSKSTKYVGFEWPPHASLLLLGQMLDKPH